MKRFIIVVLILGGLLAAGVALFLQFYSPEAQRVALERRLSEAFGAPAHIGTLRLSLTGGFGVEARDVRVELDPAYGEGSLLEIDEVGATVSVWHFLTTRELGVRAISVTRPRFRLVKRQDGTWNWSTLGTATGASANPAAGPPRTLLAMASPLLADDTRTTSSQLERIDITDATATLIDATVQPPASTEYRGLALEATLDSGAAERHVTGRVSGKSGVDGGELLDVDVPFDIRLSRVGDAGRWKADGNVTIGRIATRNVHLEEIVASFALDEAQRLVFSSLRMRLYNGAVDGSATIDLGTAMNRFTMQGRVAKLDITRAIAPKPELSGTLEGMATATFQVKGELGSYADTLTSLEGEGKADIENARIKSVNLLAEISKKAQLTPIEFSETDTKADALSTSFRFERGVVRLIDAKGSRVSGCVDLAIQEGTFDLGRNPTVNIVGSVTILPEIQQRVRADSTAAQLLLAAIARGSGAKIPVRVRGALAAPTVDLDWSSVARSMLFGLAVP